MLHYMIITQLFLRPQLVPHTAQVDVQTFLQSQLVPHTAHSRCSTLSSASACTSHSTQSMFNYFFSLSLYLTQYKSMLNCFFSLSFYLTQYKWMLKRFFSLRSYPTQHIVDSHSAFTSQSTVKRNSFFSLSFGLLFFRP